MDFEIISVERAEIPPRQLWCYLNISDFTVAWHCYMGTILPIETVAPEGSIALSMRSASLLRDAIKNRESHRVINELQLEHIRQVHYPQLVSRLTGAYYFEDLASCEKAHKLWGTRQNHFTYDCLVEVAVDLEAKFTRVDSNWISYYQGKPELGTDWMHEYWQGNIFPAGLAPKLDTPLWEVITKGRGLIWGTRVREQAYRLLCENHHLTDDQLALLELSRIATCLGSNLGQITPFITQEIGQGDYAMTYQMNFDDAENPDFLERLGQYIQANPEKINHQALGPFGADKVRRPDLRHLTLKFKT